DYDDSRSLNRPFHTRSGQAMLGPSDLRRACLLPPVLAVAALFPVGAPGDGPKHSSGQQTVETRELAAAGQDDDTPDRPRRKSPQADAERRKKVDATARSVLDQLHKSAPGPVKNAPVPAGTGRPQNGAVAIDRRIPSGPGDAAKLGEGIYRLARNG